MLNKIQISIIIPIYNMEKYLKRCLDSILEQSISSYEVLMIDDGSKDSSKEIAIQYLQDGRFKYIYQENSGVSMARNNGLKRARGEWIAFVDPDDYLERDYLKKLLSVCDMETDIVSCCCKVDKGDEFEIIHFFDNNCIFGDEELISLQVKDNIKSKKELLLELMNASYGSKIERKTAIGVPWGKLYRTFFLKSNNLEFNKDLFRYQDNIFNMYVFDVARKIIYIDLPLYNYNTDNISDYNRKYNPKAKIYFDLISKIRYEYLKEKHLIYDDIIYQEFCGEVLRNADNILRKYFLHLNNTNSIKKRICEMKEYYAQELYIKIFGEKKAVDYFLKNKNIIVKIRVNLLLKKHYLMLIFFDFGIQTIRNMRRERI